MTFADLARREDLWKKGLEGFSVQEPRFLKGIADEAHEAGLKEGRKEARDALLALILGLLRVRFPDAPTAGIEAILRNITDLPRLAWLGSEAQTVSSPDLFAQKAAQAAGGT